MNMASDSRRRAVIKAGVICALIAVPAAVAIAVFGGFFSAEDASVDTVSVDKSIVVLPLADTSPDGADTYLANGLTEDIRAKLARVNGIEVAARTSSFYFRGRHQTPQEIGGLLGVAHVLDGTVTRSGDQLQVAAELISAADGRPLWSLTFNRESNAVFDVQDDIVRAVAAALGAPVSDAALNLPGGTRHTEAYDLMLRAVHTASSIISDPFRAAIENAERAVSLDPMYAGGWIALGNLYATAIRILPPHETAEFAARAQAAFETADSITPASPAVALARGRFFLETGNLVAAHAVLAAANAAFGASDPEIGLAYGRLLTMAGRSEEAVTVLERARERDPFAIGVAYVLSSALLNLGRMDAARAEAQRGLGLEGMFDNMTVNRMLAAYGEGDRVRAAKIYREIPTRNYLSMGLGRALAGGQLPDPSVLAQLAGTVSMGSGGALALAYMSAAYGHPELALRLLRRQPDNYTIWMGFLSEMRMLPEFKEYVHDHGLLELWRATGRWNDHCRPAGADDFECS